MFSELKILPAVFKEVFELLRPYIGIVLLFLLLIGGGIWIFSSSGGEQKPIEITESSQSHLQSATSSATPSAVAASALLAVDVSGAVKNPGVYEVLEDSRVEDALEAAGGLADDASTDWVAKNLNLAAKLSDGDKIYIPTQREIERTAAGVVSGLDAQVPLPASAPVVSETNCSKVNINSASAGTLEECLSGIGPTYAQRIVEYRESHGGFKSIEEIQEVKGIGPATFAKIKDQITVD